MPVFQKARVRFTVIETARPGHAIEVRRRSNLGGGLFGGTAQHGIARNRRAELPYGLVKSSFSASLPPLPGHRWHASR